MVISRNLVILIQAGDQGDQRTVAFDARLVKTLGV